MVLIMTNILKLGINKFPELKKFKNLNIESLKPIRKANISIVSALLEHLYEPTKVIKYLIKNTTDCLMKYRFLKRIK